MFTVSIKLKQKNNENTQENNQTKHEQEHLIAILESIDEGILITDTKGNIILSNKSIQKILDIKPTISKSNIQNLFEDKNFVLKLENMLATNPNKENTTITELIIKEPKYTHLSTTIKTWKIEEQLKGLIIVLSDTTDLKRLDNIRKDFISNASHELRTPVAIIRGYAEALLDDESIPNEARTYVEIIEKHTTRLTALLDDTLSLSRIESSEYSLNIQKISIKEIVPPIVETFSHFAFKRKVNLKLELQKEYFIKAEPLSFERVLRNLIENALKYTPPGGDVKISFLVDDTYLKMNVEDTGVGIPENDLPRVFERFYRVDSARSRVTGGTGLGLSIVKHLMIGMNGDISVQSVFGMGSVFSARFLLWE